MDALPRPGRKLLGCADELECQQSMSTVVVMLRSVICRVTIVPVTVPGSRTIGNGDLERAKNAGSEENLFGSFPPPRRENRR